MNSPGHVPEAWLTKLTTKCQEQDLSRQDICKTAATTTTPLNEFQNRKGTHEVVVLESVFHSIHVA